MVRVIDSATGDIARTTSGWIEDEKYGVYFKPKANATSGIFDSTVTRTGRLTLKLSSTDITGRSYGILGAFGEYNPNTSASIVSKYGISVKPLTSYKITCYVKTNNAFTNAVGFDIWEGDATGTRTTALIASNKLTGTNDWTIVTKTWTTQATTTNIAIWCVSDIAGNISDAWFDVNDPNFGPEEVSTLSNPSSLPALLYPSATAVTSEDNIDQSQVVSANTARLGEDGSQQYAQQFLPTKKNLTGIIFQRGTNTGTYTGNVTISIQANGATVPSGTPLVSKTYTNAQWTALSATTDYTALLPLTLTVDGSTTYWIVFDSSTADNSNYTRVVCTTGNLYTNGVVRAYRLSTTTWSTVSPNDSYFKTLYSKNTTNFTVSTDTETVSVTAPTTDGWADGTVIDTSDGTYGITPLTLAAGTNNIYYSSNGPATADGTVDPSLQGIISGTLYYNNYAVLDTANIFTATNTFNLQSSFNKNITLGAGLAAAGGSPLKLTSGTDLSATEAGVVEYDGTNFHFTNSGLKRRNITSEQYVQSRGLNLITNGSGLMLDNTNFSTLTFDQVETHGGGGSFRVNVSTGSRLNDEFIPVDTSKVHRMVVWAKAGDVGGGNFNAANKEFIGVSDFDIDQLPIQNSMSCKQAGSTDTTLAADLNPGDLTVTLTDATGWYNSTTGTSRLFNWWPYTNAKGYTWANYTYTRNRSSNYSNNSNLGAWGSPISGGISSPVWASADSSLYRAAGSFLADGVMVGDTLTSTNVANPGPLTVATATATKLTFVEAITASTAATTLTYTGQGIIGNVITLRVPWAGPAIAAGQAVRNAPEGGTYKYILASNISVPNAWTKYSNFIGPNSGNGIDGNNNFRTGTAFLKMVFLINYHGAADTNMRYSDITFNSIENDQSAYLVAPTGDEVGYTFRYTTNKAAGNDTGMLIQMTDTASSGVSTILDLQNSTTSQFNVAYNGIAYAKLRLGIGVVATAQLHIAAGTASANTQPIKLTSGTLNTAAVAGSLEFLTDALYFTITTGAVRKTIAFTTDIVSQVEDNITDGHTTIAPSGNAVFDALALKAPLASPVFTTPITLKGYTVGTLPAGTQGDTAFCTDLLTPTFFTLAVGGGAVVGPVFYNGTAWVSY